MSSSADFPVGISSAERNYSGIESLATLAIDVANAVTAVVTLAALAPQLRNLAASIRDWRARQPSSDPVIMTVRGAGIDIAIELPPNVSRADILTALAVLQEPTD